MQMVNRNPSATELRKFGLAMILGFGVLGAVSWYLGPDPHTWSWVGGGRQVLGLVLWSLGAALLVVALGPRSVAVPVYVGWMSAAFAIGAVMTVVLMTVLFIVLLPLFSLTRLADPLRMKLKPAGESYWEDHKHHESTLERTARPF
ncbi:MAG: hypothetical protein H6816_02140 [Phycisphaerales bacterium]|nr:hypothetical protein [Phycisphaerales bacterium]